MRARFAAAHNFLQLGSLRDTGRADGFSQACSGDRLAGKTVGERMNDDLMSGPGNGKEEI